MSRTYSRRHLRWREDGDGLALCLGRTALLHVVPDERYPGMWRVRHHDGRLGDLTTITHAKDAAIAVALAELNGEETALEARCRVSPGRAA